MSWIRVKQFLGIEKTKQKEGKKSLVKATWFLACALVCSNVLGLLRDRIFVWRFGAGSELDAYYVAFRIPDLIFNLLVLGALFSAFIPIFTDYIAKKENKEAWHITNAMINIFTVVLLLISALAFFAAPWLTYLIAPGFASDPTKFNLTINLTRLMLITPIIFSLSNIFSGILNSFKRFIAYALTPIVYNLGIIFGAVYLAKFYGIYGLAFGVIIGASLHLLVQVPSIYATGYRYRLTFDFLHKGVKQIIKLMIPTAISLGIAQISLVVYTILGSALRTGTIAIINLTNNIQTFPTVVFAISIATTIFPTLAEKASLEKKDDFIHDFSWAIRQILFLIIPSTIGIILLRAQIIRLILGAAKFTWADTQLAAATLGFFAISLIAQATIPVLARSFYALKNTKTPLLASFVAALINIFLAYFLAYYYFGYQNGASGLALAFSIAAFVQAIILVILLRKKIGSIDAKNILSSLLKISFASLLMGAAVYGTLYLIAPLVNMQRFYGIFIQTISAILVGLTIYLLTAILLKCEEIAVVRKLFHNWTKK
jgi:putative peptidoglycan lipid II flippase